MNTKFAVFATNLVNRDRMLIPATELMRAYEEQVYRSAHSDIPVGLPMNMQHDMHRSVGWAHPLGLYIDSSMVRAVGQCITPVSENESSYIRQIIDKYWNRHHQEESQPYQEELAIRSTPANLVNSKFLSIEAVVISRTGITAELYPDLFEPGQGLVDKDGLTDYRNLIQRFKQIQPGVFHDLERDVLLFAHRFLRRSLSHRNKLNEYFLKSLIKISNENPNLQVRIKLDPDIIGHPGSAHNLVEMEWWRGPTYSDDIASIPDGVAEYKADERCRLFQGIDRTQIWWKNAETRNGDGSYRTFEIEELIDNVSWGIGDDKYGCRYAHAEFSFENAAITHFDGAIRAYDSAAYFERIDTSIDKAGKTAEYTKIFRLDGVLPISDWKRLLSDYYQGNTLIPEYFGAPSEKNDVTSSDAVDDSDKQPIKEADLVAHISMIKGRIDTPIALYPELSMKMGDKLFKYVEIGTGKVGEYLQARLNLEAVPKLGYEDNVLNLSRLFFGASEDLNQALKQEIEELSAALRNDAEAGLVNKASIPLSWPIGDIVVTLSFAGNAVLVAEILTCLPSILEPSLRPSEWIEKIFELVRATNDHVDSNINWEGINRGIVSIERVGDVEVRMDFPEALRQQFVQSGDLKVVDAPRTPE